MSRPGDLLGEEAVFGQLSPRQRVELARAAILRTYEKDESICHQGDEWPFVAGIASGRLRSVISATDGRNFVGSTWEAGQFFWSPTIFDHEPMPSTLEAVTATELYVWEGEQAFQAVIRSELAIRALFRQQTQIIRKRRQGIYSLAFNPLTSRLAQLLTDELFNAEQETVQRELTLANMAEMIASSPEVVCRMLYQFQDLGAISISRATITLHDRRALENLILRDA